MLASQFMRREFDFHDGARYQPLAGPMDIVKLRSASRESILCWKATQSIKYVDPTFATIRAAAKGLFDMLLAYHWLSSTTDPVEQGRHWLRTMGTVAEGEGFMLDAEEAGITVEKCLGTLETVEAETKRPGSVYTGLYVAGGTIWRDPRIRMSKYGPRMMHLAAYVSIAELIKHLTRTGNLERDLDAWQYSSNGDYVKGVPMSLPGITGRADLNVCFNRAGFRSTCFRTTHIPGVEKPPTIEPTPTEDEDMDYITNAVGRNDDTGAFFGPLAIKWKIMPDGSILQATEREGRGRRIDKAEAGVPMSDDDINAWPRYKPLTVEAVAAALVVDLSISGSISGSATGTARPA